MYSSLNCSWTCEELEEHLPGQVKKYIADNNIQFYTIDGVKIGKEIGLGNRINTVLQSAFFKLVKDSSRRGRYQVYEGRCNSILLQRRVRQSLR